MEMVELLVRMDCGGCERKIRKQLAKMKGIDSVDIDLEENKVTVTGYVDRRKVLKAVRKTGKQAEFWPENFRSYGGSYRPHLNNYMMQTQAFRRTYNYEKHGYNDYGNLASYPSGSSNDQVTAIFSDENPNACSVM